MAGLIGHSVERYQIIEQLGKGGMATVYRAFDTRLDRDVAIKFIRSDAINDEMFLKRFEREAKALASLSHPHIVKVLDYGEYEGRPYLVMEFVRGDTLKKKLGIPIPWRESARMLAPVARTLEYIHKHKIIHRDVKPANFLVSETNDLLLSDFGIAKILDRKEDVQLTGTGVGIGTPEYMAPEQGMGKPIDGRADIYALGIVFYEMLTGRKPYQADTPMAVLYKQVSEPLPPPQNFVPTLPDEVTRVLFKALAKQPENRYQQMGEFAKALENLSRQSDFEEPQTRVEVQQPEAETRVFESGQYSQTADTGQIPQAPANMPLPEAQQAPEPQFNIQPPVSEPISAPSQAFVETPQKGSKRKKTLLTCGIIAVALAVCAGLLLLLGVVDVLNPEYQVSVNTHLPANTLRVGEEFAFKVEIENTGNKTAPIDKIIFESGFLDYLEVSGTDPEISSSPTAEQGIHFSADHPLMPNEIYTQTFYLIPKRTGEWSDFMKLLMEQQWKNKTVHFNIVEGAEVESEPTPWPTAEPPPTQAAAEPEPTAQEVEQAQSTNQVQGLNVLLRDDFSDPDSGWEVGVFEVGEVSYSDGEYAIRADTNSYIVFGEYYNSQYTDTKMEFTATQSADAGNFASYGVLCRLQPNLDHYRFLISGDGHYTIQKRTEENGVENLIDWSRSDAIKQGDNNPNTIMAVCDGPKLTLYVNNHKLAEAMDSTLSKGSIALVAASHNEEQTAVVYFDDLVVSAAE